jgi:uncharacterized protein involved in type VI secretion and phage assembly
MTGTLFATPSVGLGTYPTLATVVSVDDPENLNRVKVKAVNATGSDGQDFQVWARVAVPFAGGSRGAFFIPDVGDEVLLTFVQGDSRYPVVIGSLWNGKQQAPDQFGGSGDSVDRWLFVGKAGTRIAIVEESSGSPQIELKTPAGVNGILTDDSGGKATFTLPTGTSITMDSQGVTIQTSGEVKVQASTVEVDAGQVTVNAAMSQFNGIVQCTTLLATALVSSPAYTPGAGNIW